MARMPSVRLPGIMGNVVCSSVHWLDAALWSIVAKIHISGLRKSPTLVRLIFYYFMFKLIINLGSKNKGLKMMVSEKWGSRVILKSDNIEFYT